MNKVTDPAILKQLNSGGNKVTDPTILKQLNSGEGVNDGFSVTNTIKNIPGSAWQVAKDITYPIRHPVEFSKGMNTLSRGLGGTQPLGGINFADQSKVVSPTDQESSAVKGIGQFYKDRYGSIDNTLNTIENDPAGFALDAAGLKGLLKAGTKAGKMAVGTAVPKGLPEDLMRSSVKFPTTGGRVKRQNQIRTLLDEKILPNEAGYQKISNTIDSLNNSVDLLLSNSTKKGKTFSKDALFKHVGELRKELGGVKLDANRDITSINNYTRQFEKHLKKIKTQRVTPDQLQALKKDAYKSINWDMKQGKANFAVNETRRKIAQASRELLEEASPDIKALNKREGGLLNLQSDFERSLHRIENRDVANIGTPIKMGVGNAAGGTEGMLIGLGMGLLDHPVHKSRLALGLENLRTAEGLGVNPNAALLQSLFQSGRLENLERPKYK